MGGGNEWIIQKFLMENKDIITDEKDKNLLSAFAWWEKQRIIFNAIVGTAGISGLIIASPKLALIDIVGILVYGIIANLFYGIGFFIEIGTKHYFKSDKDFRNIRVTLFWLGLIFSTAITFLSSITSSYHTT